MTKVIKERELVLETLMEILERGQHSHIVLRNVLAKYQYLDKRERAFITRLTEGVIERMIELDYIIEHFSKVKVKKMKPVIRNILRMAVYQIKYMDSVPTSAACNEAVNLAVKKGFQSLRGFVNGVLRNIAREMDRVVYPDKEDKVAHLSVHYSMPEWIVEDWLKSFGFEQTEAILQDFLKEKPTTIRWNSNVMTREELMDSLSEEGVCVTEHPYLKKALYISDYDYLADLKAYQTGGFSVQDGSSMLVAEVANPKEGDYIIDVCAAPGGKALQLAEMMNQSGMVDARDLTSYKVDLIKENAERLQITNLTAKEWDATQTDETVIEKADIVIADLPCSGLGVIGRKPDIKYKMSRETQAELAKLQQTILSVVQAYVKPGGKLIYSTCTINDSENEDNVKQFLKNHSSFERMEIEGKQSITLIPDVHGGDGFFIACFRKVL